MSSFLLKKLALGFIENFSFIPILTSKAFKDMLP